MVELAELGEAKAGSHAISIVRWDYRSQRLDERIQLPGFTVHEHAPIQQVAMGRLGPTQVLVAAGSGGWNGGGPGFIGLADLQKGVWLFERGWEDGASGTVASDGELAAVAWRELVPGGALVRVATVKAGGTSFAGSLFFEPDQGLLPFDFRAVGLAVARGKVYVARQDRGYVTVQALDPDLRASSGQVRIALPEEVSATPTGLISRASRGLVVSVTGKALLLSYDLQLLQEVSLPGEPSESAMEAAWSADGDILTSGGYCSPGTGTAFRTCFKPERLIGRSCAAVKQRTEVRAIGDDFLVLSRCGSTDEQPQAVTSLAVFR